MCHFRQTRRNCLEAELLLFQKPYHYDNLLGTRAIFQKNYFCRKSVDWVGRWVAEKVGRGQGRPKGLAVLLGGLGLSWLTKNLQNICTFFCAFSAIILQFFCNPKFHLQIICTFSANILQFFYNPKFHLHFFCKNNYLVGQYAVPGADCHNLIINNGRLGRGPTSSTADRDKCHGAG